MIDFLDKHNILFTILLLTAFFPYVSFYSFFKTDIQPWNIILIIIFSFFLIFYYNLKFDKIFLFLLIPMFFSFFLLPLTSDLKFAFRSIAGYITLGLSPIVYLYTLKKYYKLFIKILKISTIIYFIVGLIQLLLFKNFLIQFLNNISSSSSRGVSSLTTEPSFYGITCVFLILLFWTLNVNNKILYIILLLIQIIIMGKSSIAILFLGIYLSFYFIFKINNTRIILILFFAVIIFVLSLIYIKSHSSILLQYNSRPLQLLYEVIKDKNIFNIVYIDGSINARLASIYFPIKHFFGSFFIPGGFGTYSYYLKHELMKQNFFWQMKKSGYIHSKMKNVIMSYYGSILYELGFIGLLIPIGYSAIIVKGYKNDISNMFIYLFFINTILLSAIPLTFPLVSLYIASLMYKKSITIQE